MALQTLISSQFESLRSFMETEGAAVHVLEIAPELRPMLFRVLARFEDDPEFTVCLLRVNTPFSAINQYVDETLPIIKRNCDDYRAEFASLGLTLPTDPPKQGLPTKRFEQYASEVAEAMPGSISSFVFVLEPPEVKNEKDFCEFVSALATQTSSPRAKFLVLDRQENPVLQPLKETLEPECFQKFSIAPEQIEKQVLNDLKSETLSKKERRQHLMLAGGFAFARREYLEAEKFQTEALSLADESDAGPEQATILYNLGNTRLSKGDLEKAADCFADSASVSMKSNSHNLAAISFTNLGVTLGKQGDVQQSVASFDVATKTFAALNNKPGEAYALDCKAATLENAGMVSEAEQAWLSAIAVYDQISADIFSTIKEAGRHDVVEKLTALYKKINQHSKIEQLNASTKSSPA